MPSKATRAKIQRDKQKLAGQTKTTLSDTIPPRISWRDRIRDRPDASKGELALSLVLIVVLAFGSFLYQAWRLPHWMAVSLTSWSACLLVIGLLLWRAPESLIRLPRGTLRKELSFLAPLALFL